MLFIFLCTMILEKVQYLIAGLHCSIYMLFGIVFCIYVFFFMKIKYRKVNKIIGIIMVFQLFYITMQNMLFMDDFTLLEQHFKGNVIYCLTVFNVWAVLIWMERKKEFSFNVCLKYFYYIMVANISWCILQLFVPELDVFVFQDLLSSQQRRIGMDEFGDYGRVTGLFTDSNNNAAFLVLTYIISVYIKRHVVDLKLSKLCVNSIMILSIVMCFFTLSRTGIIGLLIAFLLEAYYYGWYAKLKVVSFFVTIAVLGYYLYSTNPAIQWIVEHKSLSNAQVAGDMHGWVLFLTLDIYLSDWGVTAFGTGYNCLHVFFSRMTPLDDFKAHNYYLQCITELGAIGAIIMSYLFYCMFKMIRINNRLDEELNVMLKMLLIVEMLMNISYDSFAQPIIQSMYIVLLTTFCQHKRGLETR